MDLQYILEECNRYGFKEDDREGLPRFCFAFDEDRDDRGYYTIIQKIPTVFIENLLIGYENQACLYLVWKKGSEPWFSINEIDASDGVDVFTVEHLFTDEERI